MESEARFLQRRIATAQRVRKQLVAHIAAGGTTDMATSAMENHGSVYCDPLYAQQETSRLFHRTPIVACFSSDIANAGSRYVFDLAGTSVLLLRGKDLKLRGFLNRCSHRGTKLVATETATDKTDTDHIRCPFHAWCFDLEGKLTHVPGAEGFDQQQLQRRDLTTVGVIEHQGLVYVQLRGTISTATVQQHLGTFQDEMAQLELQQLQRVQSFSLPANSNWKYAMDTYCEGYHFSALHNDSIGSAFFSNVAVFDDYFPHWRLCFAERSLASLVDKDEQQWPEPGFSGTHLLFPNTLLVAGTLAQGEMYVRMFQLLPGQQPSQMTCLITVYAPPSVLDDKQRLAREFAYNDATSDITREDYKVATEGYNNLANAPEPFHLIYGKNEPALQAFHRALAEAMANGSKAESK